ncbi:MAG: 50S ribosomal protein L25 [Proteobacteria bacterium]|nr:50S ribosomal protein L25 [Pseudomonadota bacterium]
MEQLNLNVELRNGTGKSVTRKLRAMGKLPGVVYGLGKNMLITVDPRPVKKLLLEEGGRNKTLNLKGEGLEGRYALIKDYMIDPVSRELLHVDFLEIDINKKIEVTVLLNFVGKAAGVGEGGVLNIVERNIAIRCLPTAIPKHIDVDVSALQIGDSIHLDQLALPAGIEKVSHTNPTLVGVVPPAKEEEATPALTASAEPEVITAKKPEAEAEAGAEKKEEKKK